MLSLGQLAKPLRLVPRVFQGHKEREGSRASQNIWTAPSEKTQEETRLVTCTNIIVKSLSTSVHSQVSLKDRGPF